MSCAAIVTLTLYVVPPERSDNCVAVKIVLPPLAAGAESGTHVTKLSLESCIDPPQVVVPLVVIVDTFAARLKVTLIGEPSGTFVAPSVGKTDVTSKAGVDVGVGLGVGVAVGVGVGVGGGVRLLWTSKAPMSVPSEPATFGVFGSSNVLDIPRWSVARGVKRGSNGLELFPLSITGLPASGARVNVAPPLSASGASIGLSGEAVLPT